MTTKLTLTIGDSIICSAKEYAKSTGKSLSSVVENYLQTLSTKPKIEEEIPTQIVKLMGVIKLPKDFDYKAELGNALTKKYKK